MTTNRAKTNEELRVHNHQYKQARLFMDREVLDLPPVSDRWSEYARQLICGLCTQPSEAFAENVSARFGLVRLSEKLIPVIVPKTPLPAGAGQPQAAVVSTVSHYAHYTQEEMNKRGHWLPPWLLKLLFRFFRAGLGLLQAERVVLVDNWLLTTNPSTRFTAAEVAQLTALLGEAFPDHALSFRGILREFDQDQARTFQTPGMVHLRHRQVWVSPDCRGSLARSRDLRKDQHLLETSGYQALGKDALLPQHAERACQLYRQVYLDKHSALNLAYTPAFFVLLAKCGFMDFRALRQGEQIDALKSWFIRDGMLFGCLVGYDTTKPRRAGLYRQAVMMQTLEASQKNYPVWMSSGVAKFKSLRGGEPHDEFEALYVAHLPLWRQWGWRALARLTRRGGNTPAEGKMRASGA